MSPSPSPRLFTPPAATTTAVAPCPAQPSAPTHLCSPSPSPETHNNSNAPRDALGMEEGQSSNNKRNKTALRRVGRSMGRGLRQCSGFFKKRPDAPDEVEQVPKPVHWSEL
ncbi:uncharacterized protein BKCO1_4200039 [Diplodia corticola]|uniref:Uncharacterized protein n=1 Tax=Diplodia corticola TaxID=236234 RepID=A0A1J9QUF9_9PEZI|nr:uncharacterized protein BKCO1_4200039 [Diplodia corticola]OJD32041.1 hypothetical protein BKCO1_4200039 [Diplodia corticola]